MVAVLKLVRDPILWNAQLGGTHPPDLGTVAVALATVLAVGGAAIFTLVRHERQLIFRL
jgi:hypothetical protein